MKAIIPTKLVMKRMPSLLFAKALLIGENMFFIELAIVVIPADLESALGDSGNLK